ncbi:MAG: hypothetical protein KGP28_02620 [Bdellovibrionales bacterium]|nr:hypothetical protein [Bdellovibrionales bacterium]
MNFFRSGSRTVALAMVVGTLWGCTKAPGESSPAKVLENYIKISFSLSGVQDRKRMEELLTGDTLARLMSWSDDQFTKAFLESPKRFQGLKILENRKVSDLEAALTYELSFDEGPKDNLTQITQKKLCSVVKVDGLWKIKEVRSIRESIEYLKEFTLP